MQSIGSHLGHHIRLNSSPEQISRDGTYLQKNEMVFPYFRIVTPCSLNSMFIQTHLVPGVAEITRAYIGFNSNGPIIYVTSQSLLKNSYQLWWQQQYLAVSGKATWLNFQ